METSIPIFIVEAFMVGASNTHTGTGNPAAVCILEYDDDISDETKQKIASTMSMSVTAFVSKGWSSTVQKPGQNFEIPATTKNSKDGGAKVQRTLRWFTPSTEIALCAHATIATAKALMMENEHACAGATTIEFISKLRGNFPATLSNSNSNLETEASGSIITVNFPACATTKIDLRSQWLSEFMRELVGPLFYIYLEDQGDLSDFLEDVQYSEKEKILLFRLKLQSGEHPETTIMKVSPNFQKLMETTGMGLGIADALCTHAIIVTIAGAGAGADGAKIQNENEPDFYSRFFAPYYGIDEDSVTGIAHTILTPYWTAILNAPRGKVLWARQASARGGDLHCLLETAAAIDGDAADDHMAATVTLSGRARVVLKGELYV